MVIIIKITTSHCNSYDHYHYGKWKETQVHQSEVPGDWFWLSLNRGPEEARVVSCPVSPATDNPAGRPTRGVRMTDPGGDLHICFLHSAHWIAWDGLVRCDSTRASSVSLKRHLQNWLGITSPQTICVSLHLLQLVGNVPSLSLLAIWDKLH